MSSGAKAAGNARTWLTSLARDTRGNTLAIVAASIIPLAGMVGGGVDISRMYIVKTRLQHACDAGVLAGRKEMGGGTWAYNNNAAQTTANSFFDGNIQESPYGASSLTRAFTESAGKVSGTASATVPMTIMRVFGKRNETLTVTCDAEMRLPNTDVMFVLDVTGSMGETPSGDSQTKLQSLKDSVKCFYEIVARLDTAKECTTGTPSGGTGTQTQIRFGFVPYDTNVNVGKLLKPEWFADSWQYQSREPIFEERVETQWTEGTAQPSGTPQVTNEDPNSWSTQSSGAGATEAANATTQSACTSLTDPANDTYTLTGSEGSPYGQQTSGTNPRTVTWKTKQDGWYYQYQYVWVDRRRDPDYCAFQRRKVEYELVRTYTRTDTATEVRIPVFKEYRYARLAKDISGLKNPDRITWNTNFSFQTNVGTQGALKTITWAGCVEERATVRQATYSPIPADAEDLDIDQVPSQSDPRSLWAPLLPGLIYTRGWSYLPVVTSSNTGNSSSASCPVEARKLQSWPTASAFETYIDSLQPGSNTYHDIGLIWGARLLSPTGLFKSENEYTSQGGEIERHLIFMTDGDACTSRTNYQAYGVARLDRRQTDEGVEPDDGCSADSDNGGALTTQVDARTDALCTAIKNKNITLWVITFGGVANKTVTRMTACATSGRYFHATNAATLQASFKSIADQISALRLTK